MKNRWQDSMLADMACYASESAYRLLLMAAVEILVARYLGPDGLGLLSYSVSVFALLIPIALLGMRPILVREFSARTDWQAVLVSALAQQVPASLVAALVGFSIITLTRGFDQDATLIAVALLPLPLFSLASTLRAYLEASGRVRWIIMVGVLATTITGGFKILAIAVGAPMWAFALAVTLEASILMGGFLLAVHGHKTIASATTHFQPAIARGLMRDSWPLLLAGLGVILYMKADIFMLGLLADDSTTGIYAAASRVSEVWYFLPMAAATAIRPHLARLFAAGKMDAYRITTQRFLSAALGVSLVVVVTILVGGDQVIITLYGSDFMAAGSVLRVHALATPFVFLGVAASHWFIDRGMTIWVMKRSAIGAGVNILLNLILIPTHGALGAAVATLVSYALASVLINAVTRPTRPIFWMQARAFVLARK